MSPESISKSLRGTLGTQAKVAKTPDVMVKASAQEGERLIMGLMGLFGKGPMSEKKIDKVAKLASNPFAQPDVRMREMQRLLQDGSEYAYRGLLKRFAANANGQIADEDEKQWLEDAVVDVGERIRSPLEAFIRQNKTLSYALRAYERIFGLQESVGFFLAALEAHGPDAYRQSEAKQQLTLALIEHIDDERVLPGLLPFVEDHSDDVRWAVLDGVERALASGEFSDSVREDYAQAMARILQDDATGPRV
ncbi:MAG: hypothetical protein AAFQ82_21540, partial [Myxococcota bacterium]